MTDALTRCTSETVLDEQLEYDTGDYPYVRCTLDAGHDGAHSTTFTWTDES